MIKFQFCIVYIIYVQLASALKITAKSGAIFPVSAKFNVQPTPTLDLGENLEAAFASLTLPEGKIAEILPKIATDQTIETVYFTREPLNTVSPIAMINEVEVFSTAEMIKPTATEGLLKTNTPMVTQAIV